MAGGDGGDAAAPAARDGEARGGAGARPARGNGGRGGGRGRGGGEGGGRHGRRGGGETQASSSVEHNDGEGGQRRRGGGGGGGGRGRANRGGSAGDNKGGKDGRQEQPTTAAAGPNPAALAAAAAAAAEAEDDDAEVCFICANPVIHHAIAPCNHMTCHLCALRMRALYRTKDCPHCRTPAPYVVFTDDPEKRYEAYTDADITSTDDNIGIRYANEEIVGDTVLLLRYNCPDGACDYAGLGWPDLHRHVRAVHHKKMCDLCTRHKKVFTHEHELFTDKALERHMRHGDDRPGATDQTGFKGHPLCGFCGERFYDDDKLYEHCRNKHERCFICDRHDSRHPHYFRNYTELEKHFYSDHFICTDRECLEKKFVVFDSQLDLRLHQMSEHPNSLSKDARRDVQLGLMSEFDHMRPAYQGGGSGSGSGSGGGGGGRRGGGGGGGEGSGRRARGRDPNADVPVLGPSQASAQNMRRDEIAYQRQLAIHSAQSLSSRAFGGQLSAQATPPPSASPARQQQQQQQQQRGGGGRGGPSSSAQPPAVDPMATLSPVDLASLSPQDRARMVRHGAVIERASNLLGSNPTKVQAFRDHISSYRAGTTSAPQLIDALSALFAETSDTAVASLVREVADLFEDPVRAQALRAALQDRRAAATAAAAAAVPYEDYPALPTLGGMHGATTANSGWAAAAAASPVGRSATAQSAPTSSTRVLRLKHSTRSAASTSGSAAAAAPTPAGSGLGPLGRPVPGATWTAPSAAAAPASSAAFPALPSARAGGKKPAGPAAGTSGGAASWTAVSGASSSRSAAPVSSAAPSLAARLGGGGPSASPSRTSTPRVAAAPGSDAFPALPAAPKPLTTLFGYGRGAVRRDVGSTRDTGFSWGGGDSSGAPGDSAGPTPGESAEAGGSGKGQKKKQGRKVLVQWG